MANVLNRFMNFIGLEDSEYDEESGTETMFNEPELDNVTSFSSRAKKRPATQNNVVSLPTSGQMKMIVYHPIGYEDTQSIIDNLKSRKPVIVNMEDLEIECAQRILDFMAGAVYALNGTISKISRGIFLVVPTNYDVIGNNGSDSDGII